MRYFGIDIGAEHHVIAVIDDDEQVLLRPLRFAEDADGYRRLREVLGMPDDVLSSSSLRCKSRSIGCTGWSTSAFPS